MSNIIPGNSEAPGQGYGLGYMPYLDGLRGIAIIIVLWFHATGPLFMGGFIGVDIFFVLSGFLITGLLIKEYDQNHRIFLGRFYARRALRLLPPLIAMLLAYALACALVGQDMQKALRDVAIVFFYGANWARAYEVDLAHSLGHTWSLAIEEQFYILWPLTFIVLKFMGLSTRTLFLATLVGAIASATGRAVWFHDDVTAMRLYNGLDTRCAGLLIGCSLAFYMADKKAPTAGEVSRFTKASLTCAAFLAVITFAVRWNSPFMFYIGYFLVSVAAAGVILGVCYSQTNPLRKALETPWLVKLGKVSYGLYLWHYPIYHIINVDVDAYHIPIRWPLKLVVGGAVALGITLFSYRFIESPMLSLKSRFQAPRKPRTEPRNALGVAVPMSSPLK